MGNQSNSIYQVELAAFRRGAKRIAKHLFDLSAYAYVLVDSFSARVT